MIKKKIENLLYIKEDAGLPFKKYTGKLCTYLQKLTEVNDPCLPAEEVKYLLISMKSRNDEMNLNKITAKTKQYQQGPGIGVNHNIPLSVTPQQEELQHLFCSCCNK